MSVDSLTQGEGTRSKNSFWKNIPQVYYFLAVVLVSGLLLDQLFASGNILSNPSILFNILVRSVALGIVAVGQTFVMLGASIDLSVAYTISFTAVMTSLIMQGDPARVPLALGFVLAFGIVVGVINGLLITKLNVNPFIATLGTGLIIKGILNGMFSSGSLGSVTKGFQTLGYGSLGPIPYSIILLLVIVLLGWFILSWTKFGSHLYGIGGDILIGRLSGLRTSRILTIAHIISSVTAVIGGLFIVSRLGAGNPTVGPDGVYDLESVATTVIGGTALSGGRGGVFGTIAGVVIFGIIDTVFNQLGVDTYLKMVIRGVIIILAVASYSVRSDREAA